MNNELKKLLDLAEDLTIKISFALDYIEKLSGANVDDNLSEWEEKIKEWEKELDELNAVIFSTWRNDFL